MLDFVIVQALVKTNQNNIFFLPKDENVIEMWLNDFSFNSFVTGFSKYFKITKSLRICSLHFEDK